MSVGLADTAAYTRGAYEFPALRGRMGSRVFFVVLLPLAVVPTIIGSPRGSEFPPEVRAQRKLNERRIPEITRYILEHEDDWLFSSLTASFDEKEDFEPFTEFNENLGVLRLPLTTRLLINDGQHRRAAIQRALEEDPTLGTQTISIVLFPSESLERDQQMFSDLNRTVQKTPRSLDILYDHRDPLNQITVSVAERVPLFSHRVEKEALSLAIRSAKFITISSLYDMIKQFLGPVPSHVTEDHIEALEAETTAYLEWLAAVIPQWQAVAEGSLRPAEARMEYINAHAVFFFAIGGVGRVLRDEGEMDRLSLLGDIDWRRTNKEWQGICMLGPDIVTRRQTRTALRQQILYKLGLADSPPRPVLYNEYTESHSSSSEPSPSQLEPTTDTPLILRGDDMGQWSYRWPGNQGTEEFYASRQYEVVTPQRLYRVRVAWSERPAWGRKDRKRAIVFGQAGPRSLNFYPWTEFVETDTGQYAAPVPDPEHPRKMLKPSDVLPSRFRDAQIERTDQLFDQINNGPSLRVVVDSADEEDMIRHGYWVARIRNRL